MAIVEDNDDGCALQFEHLLFLLFYLITNDILMSQLPDRLSVIINAPITVADHTLTVLHFYSGSVMIKISEIKKNKRQRLPNAKRLKF